MAESNWLRHALGMGAFEFRRTLRSLREDTGRLVLMVIAVVFPTLLLAAMAALFAPLLRENFPAGHAVPAMVRGSIALFWLFGVFILAQRAATVHDELVAEAFVLTTVSPRTAVVGGVVAESLRGLAYVAAPGLLVTVAGAYAASSPAPLLFVPLVTCLFAVSAVAVGRLAGYAAAWLVARVPFVARHRTLLSGAVVVAVFGGYMLFQLPMLPVSLDPALLGLLPVGWLVDALAVGTAIAWSPLHAAAGGLTAVALTGLGVVGAARIGGSLWYGERVDPDAGKREARAGTPSEERPLSAALGRLSVPRWAGSEPVRTVARWTLLRTRREPQRLNFLLVPVFGGGSALLNLYLQGSMSLSLVGPATALLLGWIGGAAFALNPLGDEGPVLPTTLTSVSGRAYVRGLIAPAVLSVPAVAALTIAVSVATGTAPITALGLGVAGAVVAGVGAALAPLVGFWFPRYSAIRIGSSDEVRPPRLFAGALHFALVAIPGTALVGVVALPGLVRDVLAGVISLPGLLFGLFADGEGPLAAIAAGFEGAAAAVGSLPAAVVGVVVGTLLVAGGALTALVAYRLSVRRFDDHEPY